MNFKQIQIVGFKSFADPVKIEFQEGITAIVGPNGCGKSNVADAIRWVLGEQSSKMLRGTCMQDVIFKGTEKRKSLSFCEVSLCFDNSNKIFNCDYDEIVITRKLYRSGESEYMLNNTSCRLRDITDLLHDSGLGKSGYSIIGQGKVEEIINSKPEDRRVIFEDAAGISKFKYKKVEAERKLERTQENLVRITDIVSEIERQLKPLKHQAETAKKYLELKEKLKSLEVNEYIYQYDYAAVNKAEIESKINAILEELGYRQNELTKVNEDYNNIFNEINNIDNKISEVRDEVLKYTVALEKQAGESNLIKEKLRFSENEDKRLYAELNRLNSESLLLTEELANKQNLKHEKTNLLDNANNNVKNLEVEFKSINDEVRLSENEAQETQRKMFKALEELGDVKAQISALEAEKQTYQNQILSLKDSLKEIVEKCEQSKNSLNESNVQLNKFAEEKNSYKNLLDGYISNQNEKLNNLKNIEEKVNVTSTNIISMQHRKKMLEDMQKEYEGYVGSVKRLLTDAEHNANLKNKVVGVVASIIKVPNKFETAIEMALGNALQNIITENDNDAKELVNYLKIKEYGRATFLPIKSIKPRYFDNSLRYLLKENGCLGVASEIIEYPNKIENVILSLLGTTVVVDNINTAVSLANKSKYAFRIVTLDGDLINPQGSITGGSKKAQVANLLSRQSNIEMAEKTLQSLSSEFDKLKIAQQETTQELNELNNKIKQINENLRNAELNEATEKERCEKFAQIYNDLIKEQNKTESEIAKSKEIIEGINKELVRIGAVQSDINSNNTTDINTNNSMFDSLRRRRDELLNNITKLKIEIASYTSEILSLEQDITRIKSTLENNSKLKSECEIMLSNNSKKLNDFKNKISSENTTQEISELSSKLANANSELSKISDNKLELQANLRSLEDKRMILNNEVAKLQDKKYQQDLNLTKIDTDIEALQERVWTEYELTYNTALQYKLETFDVKNGLVEINKLKREINGLGNINVNAIEDSKLLEERHGNLYSQAQDLIKAEDDLKKIIKDLSDEMVDRFETEFNKINENFGYVFKELFGGGKARLELIDSDDPLAAGVDIIAEPPGKKLSNITLLSGGEKALTAIAILFAILKLKPMPFCLLDEIEAALDEANVARFAKYLQRYSSETQFIVITHKKPTMEHANALFGVTMEEKGVSKIVSVKLSEAVQNIEQ